MDKLIEKHEQIFYSYLIEESIESEREQCIKHANITKEVACGFNKWSQVNGWLYSSIHNDYTNSKLRIILKELELFDIYIKSL